MDYLDWADKDLAAGVDYLDQQDLPLYLVGHSFGGHAFGLLPNRDAIDAVYTFGTGAGWHGWMPKGERRKVQFMWNLVLPLIVAIKGYQAWNWLGLGEDLPKGVYRDWKHWCRFPRYFFDDPKMAWLNEHFAAVRTPIVGAVSLDDLWAGPESRDAFMSAFSGAAYQPRDIDPKALGLKPLGHMGYFRPYAEPLWRDALDWFASQPQAAAAA
jgi:predicted alpha/beta hydrolase